MLASTAELDLGKLHSPVLRTGQDASLLVVAEDHPPEFVSRCLRLGAADVIRFDDDETLLLVIARELSSLNKARAVTA